MNKNGNFFFFNFLKGFASVKVMSNNKPFFIWEIGGPKSLEATVLHNEESQHYPGIDMQGQQK
jgi:hypothetical protein